MRHSEVQLKNLGLVRFFKGLVHAKIKSLITHPHAVPTL